MRGRDNRCEKRVIGDISPESNRLWNRNMYACMYVCCIIRAVVTHEGTTVMKDKKNRTIKKQETEH